MPIGVHSVALPSVLQVVSLPIQRERDCCLFVASGVFVCVCAFSAQRAFVAAGFEGPSLVGGGCSSFACRLCVFPVSCLDPIAHAYVIN